MEYDAVPAVPVEGDTVDLGVDVDAEGRCRFLSGTPLQPVGPPFQATEGRWVGAALGLFATGEGAGAGEFGAVRLTAADANG